LKNHQEWEPSMSEITTIGVDVAKHVFQVHGIDAQGTTVLRKRLRRGQVLAFFSRIPRCVVGLEACATAHYWARELGAIGHEVRLMPAQYVKAYIKRNKPDAADAEAICEAVGRPTTRFVPVKTADQQAAVLLHRGRERLVRQRMGLVNALRGHLAEFGVIAPQGREATHGLAQEQPRQPAPGERSGHRPYHRHSHRRHGSRTERLPQWARVRGLAGSGATAEFHRRQISPGQDIQARQPIFAPASDQRRQR
jgi:transposase